VAESRLIERSVGGVVLLGLVGCASFSSLRTARALDRGEYSFTVAPGLLVLAQPDQSSYPHTPPTIQLAGRYGLADGFDIGVQVSPDFELSSTIQLARGSVFDLAVCPRVGLADYGSGGAVPFYFSVLGGLNLPGEAQLVLGPEVIPFLSLQDHKEMGLFVGGTLGLSLKLSRGWRMMPEVGVFYPAVGVAVQGDTLGPGSWALSPTTHYQFAIGFSYGGYDSPHYSH
jgi:hypothetical protein